MQRQGINQRAKILKILNKNKFVSGEEIARLCHISRIAAWKHINYLISNEVKIKIHPNKGYEFLDFGNRLLPEIIKINLHKENFITDIIYFDEIDSTNEYAKKILKEGTLVIAEQQARGKGRLGRHWYSEKQKDILCSIILFPKMTYPYLPLFNIIGTLAVARAVTKLYSIDAGTKWPNDVLINYKKFAGILVEFEAELDLIDKLILGIGINVNSRLKLKNATSLSKAVEEKVDRVKILVAILDELEQLYRLIQKMEFKSIQRLWRKFSLDYGQKVGIVKKDLRINGISNGIDTYGNLILKKGRKYQTIHPTYSLKLI